MLRAGSTPHQKVFGAGWMGFATQLSFSGTNRTRTGMNRIETGTNRHFVAKPLLRVLPTGGGNNSGCGTMSGPDCNAGSRHQCLNGLRPSDRLLAPGYTKLEKFSSFRVPQSGMRDCNEPAPKKGADR